MTFYLQPPKGDIPIHKLEDFASKRLQFLLRLIRCRSQKEREEIVEDSQFVDQSECLIANTVKDSVSHHILRLFFTSCGDTGLFFVQSESVLFDFRLSTMTSQEFAIMFKTLEKSLKSLRVNFQNGRRLTSGSDAFTKLQYLVEQLKEHFESWTYLSQRLALSTAQSVVDFVELPFYMALNLVASHAVTLSQGVAHIPLSLLKNVLVEQFTNTLWAFAKQAKSRDSRVVLEDCRMQRLRETLKDAYLRETVFSKNLSSPALSLTNLESASHSFPPCMSSLYTVLKRTHRLRHKDRIQLTLFLKGLGMPVHDALLLWKHEYSQPSSYSNGCTHGWHGNERRYIYNIRHLYGLEGSRINYSPHSCLTIQARSSESSAVGICPFASKDDTSLTTYLKELALAEPDIEDIVQITKSGDYSQACGRLLSCRLFHRNACSRTSCSSQLSPKIVENSSCSSSCSSRVDNTVYVSTIPILQIPSGHINSRYPAKKICTEVYNEPDVNTHPYSSLNIKTCDTMGMNSELELDTDVGKMCSQSLRKIEWKASDCERTASKQSLNICDECDSTTASNKKQTVHQSEYCNGRNDISTLLIKKPSDYFQIHLRNIGSSNSSF